MAKAKKVKASDLEMAFKVPEKTRTYEGELAPQVSLEELEEFAGFFQSMKTISMRDQNTHDLKDVRVYLFTDQKGKEFAILGRTMLDNAFDKVARKEGGWEKLEGLVMHIERGEDTKLGGGRTLGNYKITCWEDGD